MTCKWSFVSLEQISLEDWTTITNLNFCLNVWRWCMLHVFSNTAPTHINLKKQQEGEQSEVLEELPKLVCGERPSLSLGRTDCSVSLFPSFLALLMCILPARKDRTAWVQVGCSLWGLKSIPLTNTHERELLLPTWGDESVYSVKFLRSSIGKIV